MRYTYPDSAGATVANYAATPLVLGAFLVLACLVGYALLLLR